MNRGWMLLLLLPVVLFAGGCPKPPADDASPAQPPATSATDGETASGAGESSAATTPVADEPAPLLEPFNPPALAELDAQVTWEEQPVRDAFEMMREEKQQQPPLVSVDEALSMKNDSRDANEKILSALGQYPASAGDVDYEARFDRCVNFDLNSTNPILYSTTVESELHTLTGLSLFSFDRTFTPFGADDALVSWHVSSDRMFDKVVLRDDLFWSDGQPITAHDVEFTFQTIMNPKVPVPAVRSGVDELKWVKAYDDRTVVFFHKQPLATNVWNILFPVIPRHVYESSLQDDPTLRDSDYHIKLESAPVSGGPYRLKSRVVGQEFVVERREDWYLKDGQEVRRKPYFKEIRFRVIEDPNTALLAINNGQVHDYQMNPEQWTTQTNDADFYKNNTKSSGTEWGFAFIFWNQRTPFFADQRVRQAMSYTLDYKEMLDEICYGIYEPCSGTFHPDSWMAPKPSPQPYQQDLDKAEALLDEAGWTDSDGDGIRDKMVDGRKTDFDFSILLGEGSKTTERIVTLLAENLGQIGITCRPQPIEFTVMLEKARKHEFQALTMGLGAGADPTTSENIYTTNAIKNGRNYASYSNPEVDELFEQGKREFDRAKRAEIYGRIHMLLWEDQPMTWLYNRNAFYGFNKRLRGYTYSPRGPYTYGPGIGSIYMAPE
ncbi:MAG: peptide-binding protein [Planctomycetaceae bacterium]|nr:peptide-binding protein [Planctomycetaceae bacterium]